MATREPFKQPAVVTDQDDAGAHPGQFPFQPFDAGQVQMIGRLVEQQDVGRGSQGASQSGAACLAAGQGRRVFIARKAEFLEQVKRAVATVRRLVKPRLDIGEGGAEAGQIGFLRQVLDRGARLGKAALRHRAEPARRRCAARSICPSRCDRPGRSSHRMRRPDTRRKAAAHTEGQADILQQEQRQRHVAGSPLGLAPNGREPGLPLSRQAGRAVVMIQLHETG